MLEFTGKLWNEKFACHWSVASVYYHSVVCQVIILAFIVATCVFCPLFIIIMSGLCHWGPTSSCTAVCLQVADATNSQKYISARLCIYSTLVLVVLCEVIHNKMVLYYYCKNAAFSTGTCICNSFKPSTVTFHSLEMGIMWLQSLLCFRVICHLSHYSVYPCLNTRYHSYIRCYIRIVFSRFTSWSWLAHLN